MEFGDLKLRQIQNVVRFTSTGRGWPAVNRPNHIMGIHLSGRAIHKFADRKFTMDGRMLFFFNQKEDYRVRVLQPGEAFSVHFTTYEQIETPSFWLPVEDDPEFERLLVRLQALVEQPDKQLQAAALFYTACEHVESRRKKAYAPRDGRIETARAYMDLHFREKDCLDRAAELCGVSRRRFSDLFSQRYQMTPNRCLVLHKVRCAESLLQIDGLSVSEVAFRCGFNDVSYFSKVFKHETGCVPSCAGREPRHPIRAPNDK